MKILFFENSEILYNIFKSKLNQEGFENIIVYEEIPNTSEKLIELILKENPDLIISEIIINGMDGFTMVKILKNDLRTRKYKIIAWTNLNNEKDRRMGLNSGFDEYWVHQNLSPEKFVERIKKVFNL